MKDYTIYITEEIAKFAMTKGFHIKSSSFPEKWIDNKIPFFKDERYIVENGDRIKIIKYCAIPTADQICNWLRTEYKVLISIFTKLNGDYDYYGNVCKMDRPEYGCGAEGNDYENVLISCINKALELI